MAQFILHGTSACHLCDTAEQMLQLQLAEGAAFVYIKTDISDCEVLFERYGVRIPVLEHPDGRELNWPFSALQLAAFLGS